MMRKDLLELISQFNDAQQQAVDVLESNFGCSRPESQLDYIFRCVPLLRAANYISGGFKIRPHGIGMVATGPGLNVDFDFGENGQAHGFDAYRLHYFAKRNKLRAFLLAEDKIKASILQAVEQGEIIEDSGMGSIYYLAGVHE